MSGQSCVWEQGSGVKGSSASSVIAVVSFKTGKKVRRSQSCPPSSSSSLASAPTSHKILGSVTKEIHFPHITANTHIKEVHFKNSTGNIFLYLCHLLFYFCSHLTCQFLNPDTAFLVPVVTIHDTVKGWTTY